MTTQAQLIANRINGAKSAGPKTIEGKHNSAKNAMTHGLRSTHVIAPSEDPAEFEAHRTALLEELNPVGPMETILADRIVTLTWQLSRAASLQAQSMHCMTVKVSPPKPIEFSDDDLVNLRTLMSLGMTQSEVDKLRRLGQPALLERGRELLQKRRQEEFDKFETKTKANSLGGIAIRDFSQTRVLERLVGYEQRIENSLYKTRMEFERLQLRRTEEKKKLAQLG